MADAPKVGLETHNQVYELEKRIEKVSRTLFGDATLGRREFETTPSVNSRIFTVQGALWGTTSAPSGSMVSNLGIASKQMAQVVADLRGCKADLEKIEAALDAAGAPFTPNRGIEWKN